MNQNSSQKIKPVRVDDSLVKRLTLSAGSTEGVFTGDAFYRYPDEYRRLEHHMEEHIRANKGNYLVLVIGASSGKGPISTQLSWEEVKKKVDPSYLGDIAILALEYNDDAIRAFTDNNFPIHRGRDKNLERVYAYASARIPADTSRPGPSFIKPSEHLSFSDQLLGKIHYIRMNAESPDVVELPKVFGADGFDAVMCHTTSRYFADQETSMRRIKTTLRDNGLLSHIR